MLKYRIMYAAVLIASAAAFVYINTAMSLLLVILLLAVLLFVKLSVLDNTGKISVSFEMTSSCVMGKGAKPLAMTIKNKSRLPMGSIELVLLCENHMFGEVYEEKVRLYGSGKNQVYDIPLNTDKCGRCTVEIKEIYCCDMLNITRSKLDFRWKKIYTVYPPLPELQIHAEKLLNAEFGGYNYDKARKGSDNSEVFDIREYAEGDNLSAVHWKLSAKADDIIIREWSRPNNFRIIFMSDLMKKDLQGEEVGADVLATIMGITAAASRELMGRGIGHNASMLNHGMQLDASVHQMSDCTNMFDEMMGVVIPEGSSDFTDEFLALNLHNRYSKLIYVGPENNAHMLAAIAAHIDVTAIAVGTGGEATYDRNEGYPIYSMSVQDINSKSQFIEL